MIKKTLASGANRNTRKLRKRTQQGIYAYESTYHVLSALHV